MIRLQYEWITDGIGPDTLEVNSCSGIWSVSDGEWMDYGGKAIVPDWDVSSSERVEGV